MTSISFDEMIHYLTEEGGIIKNTSTGMVFRYNKELGIYEVRYPELSHGKWKKLDGYEFGLLKLTYHSFKKIDGIEELFQKLETENVKFYVKEQQMLDNSRVLYELSKHSTEDETYLVNYLEKPELLQIKYDKEKVETCLIYGLWELVTE